MHGFVRQQTSAERLCCEQLLELAETYRALGSPAQARGALVEVIRLARRSGDPGTVSRAVTALSYLGLGITDPAERFILVEHILLRPIADDSQQQTPLLGHSVLKDPYSLQLSLIFPDQVMRYRNPQFKQFAEQTARDETPAHLAISIQWLEADQFARFRTAYTDWLEKRRAFWQRQGSKSSGVLP